MMQASQIFDALIAGWGQSKANGAKSPATVDKDAVGAFEMALALETAVPPRGGPAGDSGDFPTGHAMRDQAETAVALASGRALDPSGAIAADPWTSAVSSLHAVRSLATPVMTDAPGQDTARPPVAETRDTAPVRPVAPVTGDDTTPHALRLPVPPVDQDRPGVAEPVPGIARPPSDGRPVPVEPAPGPVRDTGRLDPGLPPSPPIARPDPQPAVSVGPHGRVPKLDVALPTGMARVATGQHPPATGREPGLPMPGDAAAPPPERTASNAVAGPDMPKAAVVPDQSHRPGAPTVTSGIAEPRPAAHQPLPAPIRADAPAPAMATVGTVAPPIQTANLDHSGSATAESAVPADRPAPRAAGPAAPDLSLAAQRPAGAGSADRDGPAAESKPAHAPDTRAAAPARATPAPPPASAIEPMTAPLAPPRPDPGNSGVASAVATAAPAAPPSSPAAAPLLPAAAPLPAATADDAEESRRAAEPAAGLAQTEGRATQPGPVRATGDLVLPRQVAMQLAEAARHAPDRPIELVLDPQELGRVRMTLTPLDGAMTVTLAVERGDTADLMRRHIDTLAQEFRNLGYRDVSFEFTGGDKRHPSGGFDADGRATSNPEPAPEPEDAPDGPLRLRLTDRMDLRL